MLCVSDVVKAEVKRIVISTIYISSVLVISALVTGCGTGRLKNVVIDDIEVGINKKQVIAAIGRPDHFVVSSKVKGAMEWYYLGEEDMCGITIDPKGNVAGASCWRKPDTQKEIDRKITAFPSWQPIVYDYQNPAVRCFATKDMKYCE